LEEIVVVVGVVFWVVEKSKSNRMVKKLIGGAPCRGWRGVGVYAFKSSKKSSFFGLLLDGGVETCVSQFFFRFFSNRFSVVDTKHWRRRQGFLPTPPSSPGPKSHLCIEIYAKHDSHTHAKRKVGRERTQQNCQ
jgi:hypothetical protein